MPFCCCAALAGTDEQVLAVLSTDGVLRETVKLLTGATGNTVDIAHEATWSVCMRLASLTKPALGR